MPKILTGGSKPTPEKGEIIEAVLADIADGMSAKGAVRKDGRISPAQFFAWVAADRELQERYSAACMQRGDAFFEDTLVIADNVPEDPAAVAKAKLQIDTRKWAAAKLNAKKYGDRSTVDLNMNPMDMDTAELLQRFRQLSEKLGLPPPPDTLLAEPVVH